MPLPGSVWCWKAVGRQFKKENCSWINRACTNGSFGKRESFGGVLLKYTLFNQPLWSGRHFPESRHIVDSTLFHITLCTNQFHVWNWYHIMTPVYVSVIHVCILSLVRHFPNTAEHFNRVFSTCTVRKTKTLGTEWMHIVDWVIFRHGVFPAVKSNRVENATCDVAREI